MVDFYTLSAPKPNGSSYDFASLKGKVVLIVNTASKCGFTPQFAELEELNKKYKDQGLVILGFPCNQFASQDPEGDEGIGAFCTKVGSTSGGEKVERVGVGQRKRERRREEERDDHATE